MTKKKCYFKSDLPLLTLLLKKQLLKFGHRFFHEISHSWCCQRCSEDELEWCVGHWPDPKFPTVQDQTQRRTLGMPDASSQDSFLKNTK